MEELVARESVDELVYIGWEEEVKPAQSKDAAASKEPPQKLSSEERQSLVARIKDAKDWNRFDGIFLSLSRTLTHNSLTHSSLPNKELRSHLKTLVSAGSAFSLEERTLLSESYDKECDPLVASFRKLKKQQEEEKAKGKWIAITKIKREQTKVEASLSKVTKKD